MDGKVLDERGGYYRHTTFIRWGRAKIVGILASPAQKIVSILLAPGSKIANLAREEFKNNSQGSICQT